MFSWKIYWSLRSGKDPRWNTSGSFNGTVTGGMPKEAENWIELCEKKYGPKPDDLEYSCMKD
jgi:hypothetical protein